MYTHTPVLRDEVKKALNIEPGKKYIDATIGGGGHAQDMIKAGAIVLGIDQDKQAIEHLKKKFENEKNVVLKQDNFKNIKRIVENINFKPVEGVLLDIGVSSHQIDTPERGFSYKNDREKLDMRMDMEAEVTAEEVVNRYSIERLEDIIARYAEIENAKEVGLAIEEFRKKRRIETVGDLKSALEKKGLATSEKYLSRIFQALRIEVNDELNSLQEGIEEALDVLSPKGRLAVITFHSLEDRIIKKYFLRQEREKRGRVVTKKPETAGIEEQKINRRARSAKLRVFEKI